MSPLCGRRGTWAAFETRPETLPRHFRDASPQAQNLGRFLNESLKLLVHWKSGEEVYRNECAKLPGFSTSFINQQANAKKASYEDFVKALLPPPRRIEWDLQGPQRVANYC